MFVYLVGSEVVLAELEAGVGIEQEQRVFSEPTTPLLPPRHQRRTLS